MHQVLFHLINVDSIYTGSGKTICAEFALLRLHQKGTDSVFRCVYIAPIEALATTDALLHDYKAFRPLEKSNMDH